MATVSAAAWVLQGWIVCQSVHEQGTEPLIAPDELPSAWYAGSLRFYLLAFNREHKISSLLMTEKKCCQGSDLCFPTERNW